MTDTWAAKVLDGVPQTTTHGYPGATIEYDDAIAAIARMGAGDGLVERATAALEGVTDGPWRAEGEPWNQIVWSGAENRVCFMAHSNGLNDDRDVATARFIAFTRQWVPKAADHIAALTAQNREMALDVLASSGQAADAYAAQLAAEAERDALRERVARLEGERDDADAFNKADWFWRTMDPDDCGDSPEEAINRAMVGRFCVCEIASSYAGPTRYGFIAPVLNPESDDEEFVHFATQQEAIEAAKARAALAKIKEQTK